MDFTREQAAAIEIQDRNVMVSAGAGAGKTRVLISRIISQILSKDHPIDLDRFLVMTFTESAAAEMKERLVRELYDRLDKDPGNTRLKRQVRMVAHAEISTIHAFCNRLIRLHYHELGIDPAYRISEDGERILARKKVIDDLLEEEYEKADPAFLAFVEAFAPGNNDGKLEEMILDLYEFSRSFPNSAIWFDKVLDQAEKLADPESGQADRLLDQMLEPARDEIRRRRSQADHIREDMSEDMPEKYDKLLDQLCRYMDGFLKAGSTDELSSFLRGETFPRLPAAAKKDKEWEGYEESRELHAAVKKSMESCQTPVFMAGSEDLARQNKSICPLLEEYFSLVLGFEKKYSAYKLGQNVFDFDDLEHMALNLLVEGYDGEGNPQPSETARELSLSYREIYVDEYQDISLLQETILRMISDPEVNHVFTVGDVKQSIYRFRQARPDLFLERYDSYRGAEEERKKNEGVRIELLDNFRSSPKVIGLINYIFTRLMSRDFGGVDYDEKTALSCGEGSPVSEETAKGELLLFVKGEEGEEYPEPACLEAAMIEKEIRRLLSEGYSFRDMVILIRSVPSYMEPMGDYLREHGIPVLMDNQSGFFRTREVSLILSLLAIVDNVYQDIPMAACMLSSIGRFSEEDLARIKVFSDEREDSDDSLYSAMKAYIDQKPEEELSGRLKSFLSMISYFREKKRELPLSSLLWEIYTMTGYYYHVGVLPGGERKREHLMILVKKAEEYEKTVYKGLFNFKRYMDQLRTYDIELGAAMAREEDAVYIMTMHKSKGLEFPVVFVSGTGKQFNMMDLRKPILFDPRYGAGIDYIDTSLRYRHSSLMKDYVGMQIRKELLEEELRILYVALTRAQKKLILTGVTKEKTLQNLADQGEKINLTGAMCYLDWILPALSGHPAFANLLANRRGKEAGLPEEKEDFLDVTLFHLGELEDCFDEEDGGQDLPPLEEVLADLIKDVDSSQVRKAFSREYPHRQATTMKRKYSVSELKKLSQIGPDQEERAYALPAEADDSIPVPSFIEEKEEKTSAAQRGTIVHRIMEEIPFGKIRSEEDLEKELAALAGTIPDIDLIDRDFLLAGMESFFFSGPGESLRQMDREGKVEKELPFTIGLTEKTGEEEAETVIIQGIIDLCARGDDGLWLLDYKTDRVGRDGESVLVDRYRSQMLYYKTALEQITGSRVTRIWIYSFALRTFIPLDTGKEPDHEEI